MESDNKVTTSKDPLHFIPVERWIELEEVFKSNGPVGIPALATLKTQKRWRESGILYDFKVYCPFGKVENGMVAFNVRSDSYEVIVQSPLQNTVDLEVALKNTNLIDWSREVIFPFCSKNVIECLKRVIPDDHTELKLTIYNDVMYAMDRKTPFENVSIPQGVTFGHLSLEHTELVDSYWPHRYPNSTDYFHLLIKNNFSYALLKDNTPISWVFLNEVGMFLHIYTIEEQRKKGYGELLYKLVCNLMIEDDKQMFAFIVKENEIAHEFHRKIGFTQHHDVAYVFCNKKD